MINKNDISLQINPELPLQITKDLISIPSYQEGEMETKAIEYIANRFKKYRLDYDIFSWNGNKIGIIASIGEGKHSLILHSHLDTVPPADSKNWKHDPFLPYCSNNKLYGLGACDDKGSLASMLATFESFIPVASKLNGKLILMAVGGEERGGLGTQVAIKKGYKAEAVLLGEPTSLEPKFVHKGVLRLEITTKGSAAHASTPREGINAIFYMSKLISRLDELALVIEKENDPYTGNSSMAITTIKGGTASNMIPDTCSISIDRRLIPGQTEEMVVKEIEQVLKEYKLENRRIGIDMKKVSCVKSAMTELSEPITKLALEVASEELGKSLIPTGFKACCDMTFLRNEGNMPVVILGPGDIGMAHKMNEYIDIESLYKASRIYGKIAIEWLSRK
jgi:acetylornithine deacetylase/succinyl-diaminopimelate desuccinylase family protein